MGLDERIGYVLLGVVIGYILGRLQDIRRGEVEIQDKLEEVDMHVNSHNRDDRGSALLNVVLFAVVTMTAVGAFLSGAAADRSDEAVAKVNSAVEKVDRVTTCNTDFQTATLLALNERTRYSGQQAKSNVKLQKAQAQFLRIVLVVPPVTEERLRTALTAYFMYLQEFVEISEKSKLKRQRYKYPTSEELSACISKAVEDKD